ncbi:MAG: ABC transporter permease, partial [Promicromonosporaceae bacterium]|nr:ABC transporter permease [Promicromonosporaceae bacterium]
LALVVMFNLGNINIAERKRELATLGVLGQSRGETGAYLWRENAVLVTIGIGLGVPLGVLLHRYVITSLHLDMLSFQVHLAPLSYLWVVLIVGGFALAVDLILAAKVSRIDMVEALGALE